MRRIMLTALVLVSTLAQASEPACTELLAHEIAGDRYAQVTYVHSTDPVVPLSFFGENPHVILGTDMSRFAGPYLIVGNTLIATAEVEPGTFALTKSKADHVPAGILTLFPGIAAEQVHAMEANLTIEGYDQRHAAYWKTIKNLTQLLLDKTGLHLACNEPICKNRSDWIAKSVTHSYATADNRLVIGRFYVINNGFTFQEWYEFWVQQEQDKKPSHLLLGTVMAAGAAGLLAYAAVTGMWHLSTLGH